MTITPPTVTLGLSGSTDPHAERSTHMTSRTKADVSTRDLPSVPSGLSYEDLLNLAQSEGILDRVAGSDLIEDKRELVKTPFIITAFTFRPSDQSAAEYVSVEFVSAEHPHGVFNDGSTGIRRQLMDYCIAKGWAVLTKAGAEQVNHPEAGPGDAAGDLPVEFFDWNPPAGARFDNSGNAVVVVERVLLHAPRGLRASEYEYINPETGKKSKATTFYLA